MTSGYRPVAGASGVMKHLLLGFVVLSAAAIVYKAASAPGKTPAAPPAKPAVKAAAEPAGTPASPAAEAKTAVVYYFYTNTRCSSCKAIEAYTREAVATKLAAGYKAWSVEFKGVNVDEEANSHFVQDYFLNSKSVVVQKFSGEKPLKWAKLEKIWQLLGDKDAFIAYISTETHKLLDEK